MKKIKPVIRLMGSKYRLFNQLYNHFNFENISNFYDVFGGTGIVGVNVKHFKPDLNVYINDFDNILPLTKEYVSDNNKRFNGYGSYSQAAIEQFNKKIKNGLWEKLEIYNSILSKCFITHDDYQNLHLKKYYDKKSFFYFDPPYFSNFKAYKNQIDVNDFFRFITYFNLKNDCKIAISFKDSNEVRSLFNEWNIYELKHTNTNVSKKSKDKSAKEILITNF